MAFHIQESESLAAAWSRIEQEQLHKIFRDTEFRDQTPDTTVHEVRKRFKKLRALAKLFRYLNPEFKEKNRYYRDLGRRLSDLRDARVKLDLLTQLERDSQQDLTSIREQLEKHYEAVTDGGASTREILKSVVDDLKGKAVEQPAPESLEDPEALAKGYKRVYKRARRGHEASFHNSDPDPERDFHEYRKQAKYHYLQTQLLHKAWPRVLKARWKETKTLATDLGDDHDITLIHQFLPGPEEDDLADAETLYTLHSLLRQKREELHQRVFPLGECCFVEKPKHISRRMHCYWKQKESNQPT